MKGSFTDKIKTQKWVLPAGILVIGLVVAFSQPSTGKAKAAVTQVTTTGSTQAEASPAPTSAPDITVNGVKIPTDKTGSRDINTPGGKTHVEVSDGQTRVTTTSPVSQGTTSNTQSGNVNISIQSQSTGGTSSSSVQTYGSSTSFDGSTWSTNSTSVDSSSSH